MKILIAPTAFKGSLTPQAVARAVEDGIGRATSWSDDITTVLAPIADGGDGTIEAVHLAIGGRLHEEQVLGATSKPVTAVWLQLERQALIELSLCCGIGMMSKEELSPLDAHTYGLGQMIARCAQFGIEEINVAVGGSASTDGGMGALQSLGVTFFRKDGTELEEKGGGALLQISDMDVTEVRWLVKQCKLKVLTDVQNPLLGANGAALIFGPQKGADAQQVKLLDQGLTNYADVVERLTGKQLRDYPGSGAAGGTAFGLSACLDAEIVSGFDYLCKLLLLEEKLQECDLVVTGEGRFDSQSLTGKVVGKMTELCNKYAKRLWIVAGSKQDGACAEDVEQLIVPNASDGMLCSASDITQAVAEASVYLR